MFPDFLHHFAGGSGDGVNENAGEEIGQGGADGGSGQSHGVDHVEDQLKVFPGGLFAGLGVDVGSEQRKGRQGGAANGKTLADGGGRVADGIEFVGDFADFVIQFRHFADAAGIVGDGAVGVDRYGDRHEGEHADGAHGDAVESGQGMGGDDGDAEDDDRCDDGFHAAGQALGDGQGRSFTGGFGDFLGGFEVVAGIAFRQVADKDAADDAEHGAGPG